MVQETGIQPQQPEKRGGRVRRKALRIGLTCAVALMLTMSACSGVVANQVPLPPTAIATTDINPDLYAKDTYNGDLLFLSPDWTLEEVCKEHERVHKNSVNGGVLVPIGETNALMSTELEGKLTPEQRKEVVEAVEKFNAIAPPGCRTTEKGTVVIVGQELPPEDPGWVTMAFVPGHPPYCAAGPYKVPATVVINTGALNGVPGSVNPGLGHVVEHELAHTCGKVPEVYPPYTPEIIEVYSFDENGEPVLVKPAGNYEFISMSGLQMLYSDGEGNIFLNSTLEEIKAHAYVLANYLGENGITYYELEEDGIPEELANQYHLDLRLLESTLLRNGYDVSMEDLTKAIIEISNKEYPFYELADRIRNHKDPPDPDIGNVMQILFWFGVSRDELTSPNGRYEFRRETLPEGSGSLAREFFELAAAEAAELQSCCVVK